MKQDILLMFSGGLDSTGVFYKLIQQDVPLHVHHMNLINKENRHMAEKLAVQKICDQMKKIREFKYTESTHDCPSINGGFMWDSDLYNFMAGSLCMLSGARKVALGLTKSDLSSGGRHMKKRIERGNNILKCFGDIEKIYPVVDMTKQQIYDMLPEDLRNLTWSCRTPIYKDSVILRCGNCKTCKEFIFPKQQ